MSISVNNDKTISVEPFFCTKRYSLEEKIKKFCVLLLQTCFSLGLALISTKIRRRWTKIFVTESNKQILEIVRVFSNQQKPVQKSQKDLQEIQNQLRKNGIPLNCANPPRQKNRNDRNDAAIKEYLSYLKAKNPENYERVKSFWEKHVDKITIEELEKHLRACVKHLDSRLDKEYDVGFVAGKSSKWIAELAIPYLSKLPSHHFEHSTDVGGFQSKFDANSHPFVIFDDASYSGKQLMTLISTMRAQLASQGKKGELFLVVPFVSFVAEKRLVAELTRRVHMNLGKLKIHLITSERRIKTLVDIFPGSTSTQAITFTEWKIPDTVSLYSGVRSALLEDNKGNITILDLLTNHPPCYKAP